MKEAAVVEHGSDAPVTPPPSHTGNILRHSAIYGSVSMLVYLLAMLKTVLITRLFGTTPQMDAYTVAILAPSLMGTLVASTAAAGLVPALATADRQGENRRATLFRSSGLIVIGLCLVGTTLLALFPAQVIRLVGFKLDHTRALLSQQLLPSASLLFVAMGISAFGSAELLSRKKFLIVAAAPAISTVASFVIIWAFRDRGIAVLVWAMVVGYALQAAVVAVPAWGASRGGSLTRWRDRDVRGVLVSQAALLAVSGVANANVFIDQMVSTWMPAGNVSALNYASMLNNVVMQVVVMTVGWVALPDLSSLAAASDFEGLRKRMRVCIVIAAMIAAPVCLGILCFGQTAIRVVFQHGEFHSRSTQLVFLAWAGYTVGLVPLAVGMMAARLANALGANALLFRLGVCVVFLNAALDVVLMRWIGIFGIALASSIVATVAAVLLYAGLRSRVGIVVNRRTARFIVTACLASVVALIPVLIVARATLGTALDQAIEAALFVLSVLIAYRLFHLITRDTRGPWRLTRWKLTVEDAL